MSASLVGSEMCIRDRGTTVVAHPALGEQLSGVLNQLTQSTRAPPDGGPVSYTHLTLPTICSV
eukprot:14116390-Alexandrium_andersonii.AAC.1